MSQDSVYRLFRFIMALMNHVWRVCMLHNKYLRLHLVEVWKLSNISKTVGAVFTEFGAVAADSNHSIAIQVEFKLCTDHWLWFVNNEMRDGICNSWTVKWIESVVRLTCTQTWIYVGSTQLCHTHCWEPGPINVPHTAKTLGFARQAHETRDASMIYYIPCAACPW